MPPAVPPELRHQWQRDLWVRHFRPRCHHWTPLAKEDTNGPWKTAATITNLRRDDFELLKSSARISFTEREGDTFYGPMKGFPGDKPPLMAANYYEGSRELHIIWTWW